MENVLHNIHDDIKTWRKTNVVHIISFQQPVSFLFSKVCFTLSSVDVFFIFLCLLGPMGSTPNSLLTYVALCASDGVGIGTSQPSKDGWVPKFASLINAQQTVNLGRSGSTLADALRQQLPRALEQNAHVITIWLAVNDFNQQIFNPSILTSYKSNLNDMLSQLRSKSSKDTRILVGNIPDLAQVNIYTAFGISKQFLSAQVALWNDAIRDTVQKNQ